MTSKRQRKRPLVVPAPSPPTATAPPVSERRRPGRMADVNPALLGLLRGEPPPDPLVSVVVPSYNHAQYIESALLSVAAQTYGELELIVVDDNSTDDTYAIAQRVANGFLAARFRSVTVVRNAVNQGAHASLNRGMALARGAFITFLNSADLLAPARVRRLVDAAVLHNADFCFSAIEVIGHDGQPVSSSDLASSIRESPFHAAQTLPSIGFGFLRKQLTATTGNIFISRALYERIGGFSALRYCHDWDFVLRAIAVSEPVFVPEFLYSYRLHGANTFLQLADIAPAETAQVLGSYFRMVNAGRCTNPLAPSPMSYPGTFEYYLRKWGVDSHWDRACGRPSSGSRTADRVPLAAYHRAALPERWGWME